MEHFNDSLERRLFLAFLLFSKANWQQYGTGNYTHSEFRVLMFLQHATMAHMEGMHVSEISKRLRVTSSSITQLLNGLDAQGLIARQVAVTDRRSIFVRLTPKGEEVAHTAADAISQTFQGLMAELGEEESEHLVALLLRVFHHFHPQSADFPHHPHLFWQGVDA